MAGSISTAHSLLPAAGAASSTCLLGGRSTSVKSLSFLGSKEVRGDDVVLRSGRRRTSKVHTAGTGGAFQVRAIASFTAAEWIKEFFANAVHHDDTNSVLYKGVATIAKKRAEMTNLMQADFVDLGAAIQDKAAELVRKKRIEIQLVSNDLDAETNDLKLSDKADVENWVLHTGDLDMVADEDFYPITFKVPKDFGQPGACIIKNNHPHEFFIKSLILQDLDQNTIEFPTNAWIHNTKNYKRDRVFFRNKVYLPDVTPPGLKALRDQELEQIRGDGKGQRTSADRIYDYDVYNDLGDPDKSAELARPVLGGSKEYPYPRRLRTGRPMTKTDPKIESRVKGDYSLPYIPSDEFFVRTKNSTFVAGFVKGALQVTLASIDDSTAASDCFGSIRQVKDLYDNNKRPVVLSDSIVDPKYNKSVLTEEVDDNRGSLVILDQIITPKGENSQILHYAMPQVIARNGEAWKADEEFGRQALAGVHPNVIQLVKSYPPTSALDPAEFGEGTALADEHILPYLEGLTVAQAIETKKLFILDFHDAILPFIKRVNEDTSIGFKAHATRTILYYNSSGLLKPIAIELSLPPTEKGGAASNRVYTPADADNHLWDLAKCHASNIDCNYHQVLSHFTFTHASMEPCVIAANRQLSALHPIHTLLKPYFKDTLPINAAARAVLIGAGGNIEQNFTMGRTAFEVASKGYGALWRFDTQGLPQELIARGMAEPADASYPGSVKLVIEDYPYAQDGLDIWDALSEYVSKYVDIIYKGSDEAIKEDAELQAWWYEIVNIGHADLKDADWWPQLDSAKNLVQILTIIAWTAGPLHAAVNFGQYAYAGFPLNKTTGTRKLVPERDSPEYEALQKNPEKFLLSTILNYNKTLKILTTLELLATHSVDEEYIGHRNDPSWTSDPQVKAVFNEFSQRIQAIEHNIAQRNVDKQFPNRRGPAQVPYTLLSPTSSSGLTGRGVPNSVSI